MDLGIAVAELSRFFRHPIPYFRQVMVRDHFGNLAEPSFGQASYHDITSEKNRAAFPDSEEIEECTHTLSQSCRFCESGMPILLGILIKHNE